MRVSILTMVGLAALCFVTACASTSTSTLNSTGSNQVERQPARPAVPQGYTNHGNGTISDKSRGLMWAKTVPSWPMRHEQARIWALGLRLGGHTNWRLPTANELETHNANHFSMTEIGPNADQYGFVMQRRPYVSDWIQTFGFVLPSRPLSIINYWSTTEDHSGDAFMGGPCVLVVMLAEGFNSTAGMRKDAAMNYAWAVRSIENP